MALLETIKELELQSKLLDPGANDRQILVEKVNQYTENFLTTISTQPVYQNCPEEGANLYKQPIREEPEDLDTILKSFDINVIQAGLNSASPGHFGYIPGSGLYASALGDFLAAVTNRYSGVYAASPGAVRMELMVIKWFAREVGYPESAAGDLTSGGSIANLSSIVAARDAADLKARDYHKAVVYLTAHTHHCVAKAVRTAGMRECVMRLVPVDDHFRMIPGQLEKMIQEDKARNLIPWLVVASAGTTDTGSVDPLYNISEITRKNNVWFHVDGAYGASFVLCGPGKKVLKGIERSDSLSMDPHKGLFVSFGTGLVLVRNGIDLHRPYQYQANYLQDGKILAKMEEISPAELSPELTRHFRGLRIWLALKLAGVRSFRAALEEKMLLARYFYEILQTMERIETGPSPDLSIVIFRYIPKQGNANRFNRTLMERIMNDGAVFMSSTMINGNFMLRLAVLSFRTHLEKVDQAIIVIKDKICEIENE